MTSLQENTEDSAGGSYHPVFNLVLWTPFARFGVLETPYGEIREGLYE